MRRKMYMKKGKRETRVAMGMDRALLHFTLFFFEIRQQKKALKKVQNMNTVKRMSAWVSCAFWCIWFYLKSASKIMSVYAYLIYICIYIYSVQTADTIWRKFRDSNNDWRWILYINYYYIALYQRIISMRPSITWMRNIPRFQPSSSICARIGLKSRNFLHSIEICQQNRVSIYRVSIYSLYMHIYYVQTDDQDNQNHSMFWT